MARGRVQLSIGQVGRRPQAEHRSSCIGKNVSRAQCPYDLGGVRGVNSEKSAPAIPRYFHDGGDRRIKVTRPEVFLEERNLTTADVA